MALLPKMPMKLWRLYLPTAGPAPLIWSARVFVQRGHRRTESQQGLLHYGIPLDRQFYAAHPDGKLQLLLPRLHSFLSNIIFDYEPEQVVTAGEDGYDGHPDHVATHMAALAAVADARELGMPVELLGLSNTHTGEIALQGNQALKLGAVAFHASQTVHPDLTRWGDTDLYAPLFTVETYDIVPTDIIDTRQTMALAESTS
jgi:LmbE family N-acetylglucosaminyl deacetylase